MMVMTCRMYRQSCMDNYFPLHYFYKPFALVDDMYANTEIQESWEEGLGKGSPLLQLYSINMLRLANLVSLAWGRVVKKLKDLGGSI